MLHVQARYYYQVIHGFSSGFICQSLEWWFSNLGSVRIIYKTCKKHPCERILSGEIQARVYFKSSVSHSDFYMQVDSIGQNSFEIRASWWCDDILGMVGLLLGVSCVSRRCVGSQERLRALSVAFSAFQGKSQSLLIKKCGPQASCLCASSAHQLCAPQIPTSL